MTVLENLMVQNHFQSSVENDSLTLGLPELDIEAVFFITDSPESFSYFAPLSHSKAFDAPIRVFALSVLPCRFSYGFEFYYTFGHEARIIGH